MRKFNPGAVLELPETHPGFQWTVQNPPYIGDSIMVEITQAPLGASFQKGKIQISYNYKWILVGSTNETQMEDTRDYLTALAEFQ